MRKILYSFIALLCAVAQGAWATDYNVSNETQLRGAIENGANITLTQDITISSAITVGNGQTVTINLNNHTLNRGCTSRGSQTIGVFSGGTLHLSNGTVTGGWGGGGGAMFNEGTMHLTNVIIDGNTADDRGGGISNNGTLTMTGCTVSNNTSRDAKSPAGGGGIFNYEGKTATLTNCTIKNNRTNNYGGGGICNYGTMTINNCTVTGNNANTKGGGIFCSTTSTLNINGCDITGNIAGGYGDGIYIDNSTLNMKGKCVVKNNNDGNIYLYGSGTVITVNGAFDTGSSIGVGFSDYGRKFTSGFSTYNSGHEPGDFFTSDNGYYGIGKKDGEAYPGVSYWDHSWEGGDTDGHVVSTRKILNDDYSEYDGSTSLAGGWYVFRGSHTYENRIACHGDVKFILQDGCNIEFKKGIHIDNPQHLTIYAQDNGSGKLRCTGGGGENAAIGGNEDYMSGYLVIHGGDIYAEASSNNAAGIGGGNGSGSGMQSVTIWDGIVTAKGHSSGAGIGGGQDNASSNYVDVTIYGGTVRATGGTFAAGIGGGEKSSNGAVNIYGGTVYATGGGSGAGIGGGEEMDQSGVVNIYNGYVEARSQQYSYGNENYVFGAGIGGGGKYSEGTRYGNGGEVNIYGGTVIANSYTSGGDESAPDMGAACIGGGGCNENITVGGNGGRVTITGGTVELTKGNCGIGGADGADGGTVVITGGTVKIHLKKNWGSDGMFIGAGDDKHSNGSLTLADNLKVSRSESGFDDASPYISPYGNRVSLLQSQGTISKSDNLFDNWVTIEACNHPSGFTYSQKNSEQHHVNCASGYCKGYDENHTMEDVNGLSICSECGFTADYTTTKYYMATTDGSDYYEEGCITYALTNGYVYPTPECSDIPCYMKFLGWKQTADKPASVMVADNEDITDLVAEHVTRTSGSGTGDYYARYQRIWYNETNSGSGTHDDPYKVASTTQLNQLATYVNGGTDYEGKYFQVTTNIEYTYDGSANFTAIGSETTPFNGTFDGQGFTIKEFSIGGVSTDNQGLFGYVGANGTVKNLKVNGGYVTASTRNNIGAVAGTNLGTLINCIEDDMYLTGNSNKGGIVGYNGGTVEGCVSTKAKSIVGTNSAEGTVSNCLIFDTNGYIYESNGSTANSTEAYTVSVNTTGLRLAYGTPTATYSYNGIVAYSFDQGDNTTAPGLFYSGNLYAGVGTAVTFNALAPMESAATNVQASHGTLVRNKNVGPNNYTLTMAAADAVITATLLPTTTNELTLLDAPGNEDATNASVLDSSVGQTFNVTLSGRTLWKDGSWNTLCLPFSVSADQIIGNDQLVADYLNPTTKPVIMELDVDGKWAMENGQWKMDNDKGTNQTGLAADGTLYLFFKSVTSITARTPYIIRWNQPDSYVAYNGSNAGECSDIVNPVYPYSSVSADAARTVTSSDNKVQFIGNFDPVSLTGGDKSNLYLGADNNLYYPDADMNVNAFRAYFHVAIDSQVKAFSLHFGDDYATPIEEIVNCKLSNCKSSEASWYDLQGRKLSGKPSRAGVYIYNGKKTIIK